MAIRLSGPYKLLHHVTFLEVNNDETMDMLSFVSTVHGISNLLIISLRRAPHLNDVLLRPKNNMVLQQDKEIRVLWSLILNND